MTKQKFCIVTCLEIYNEKSRVSEEKFKGDSETVIFFGFSHMVLDLKNGVKSSEYLKSGNTEHPSLLVVTSFL